MCKVHSSRKRASENIANLNDRISDCKWSERTKREHRLEKSADSLGGKGGWTWANRIAILVTQLVRYVKYRSKNRNKTETPDAATRGARAQSCPLIGAHRLVNPDYQRLYAVHFDRPRDCKPTNWLRALLITSDCKGITRCHGCSFDRGVRPCDSAFEIAEIYSENTRKAYS